MKTIYSMLFVFCCVFQVGAQQNKIKEDDKSLFQFYGFIRLNATYDFQNLGRSDLFKPSVISVPKETPPNAAFFMSAKQSRLGVALNKNTKVGPVNAVLEIDFHNTSDQVLGLARIRKAYVQWKGFTIGQTWSTFYDIQARPHIVDFEGASSSTLNRAPMIKYSLNWGNDTFTIGIENPIEQISVTGNAVVENQNIPDLLSSYKLRWNNKKNFVTLAGLVRQLRYLPENDEIDAALGLGGMITGKINTFSNDNLKFQFIGGRGIARYIEGLRGLGYDGVFNAESNNLEPLDLYGGFLAYQHHWNRTFNSSLVIGTQVLGANSLLETTDLKRADYASVNLFYQPLTWMTYGIEYLYGRRENLDGASENGSRIQLGATLNF
jgi:hypothetical protein